mmetsp:Transcript_93317/g.301907  ORF Transcript_93317/g.301907 Transcript_93317/m.301907 type:complete len:226 (-) Transcript_93317:371-1048(-)
MALTFETSCDNLVCSMVHNWTGAGSSKRPSAPSLGRGSLNTVTVEAHESDSKRSRTLSTTNCTTQSAGPKIFSDTLRRNIGNEAMTFVCTEIVRHLFGLPDQVGSSSKYWSSCMHPSLQPRNMRPVALSAAMALTTTSSVATMCCVRTGGSRRPVAGSMQSACSDTSTGVASTKNQSTPETNALGRAIATPTSCWVTPWYSMTSGWAVPEYLHKTRVESKDLHMC